MQSQFTFYTTSNFLANLPFYEQAFSIGLYMVMGGFVIGVLEQQKPKTLPVRGTVIMLAGGFYCFMSSLAWLRMVGLIE